MNEDYDIDKDYMEGRIIKESKLKWQGITSNLNNRIEYVNYIRITDVLM